jgi:hypothetical protein
VGVDLPDAPTPQGPGQSLVKVRREGDGLAGGSGQKALRHDVGGKGGVLENLFQNKNIIHKNYCISKKE